MNTAEPGSVFRRIVFALVGIDLLIIVLHLATDGVTVFNLDAEGNVPTWHSSAKLLAIAAMAVLAYGFERRERPPAKYHRLWLGVAALFTALSLDETASLHERLARALVSGGAAGNIRNTLLGGDATKDSFAWVVLFAPFAVGIFFFLIAFAWARRDRLRRVLPLGAGGIGCYILAMILEPAAVYFTPPMATWDAAMRARYRLLTVLEESAEIVGTSLLLLTVVSYVVKLWAADNPASGATPDAGQ